MRRTRATFYGSGRTPGHDGRGGERGTSTGVLSQSIIQGALQLRSILESDPTREEGRGLAPWEGEESYRHCQEAAAHGPARRIDPGTGGGRSAGIGGVKVLSRPSQGVDRRVG